MALSFFKNLSLFGVLILFPLSVLAKDYHAATQAGGFDRLKESGHIAIMRHSLAPGTGDPDGFRLDDCKTQRNISSEGKKQAQQLGAKLQKALGSKVDVFSSQWCRCQDTAKALALGQPQVLQNLNSFFRSPGSASKQTKELRQWILNRFDSENKVSHRPVVLVTHQVNITELLGVYPKSGELFIVKVLSDGTLQVVGSDLF